ncbi:MAG: carboxypeptidase-like regulatory domain-containing protein [Spirosomataceae bacterium]
MKLKYWYWVLCILSNTLFAQTLKGRVVDESTQQPIVGVGVQVMGSSQGTITNTDGEFALNVTQWPVEVVFSHVSYQKMKKTISENAFQRISLPIAVIQLGEATAGNPAVAILNAVVQKAVRDSNEVFHYQTYYQKVSRTGTKFTRIHEAFLNIAWKTTGVTQWQPLQARMAELEESRYRYGNFLFSTFLETVVIRKYVPFPLNIIDITKNYHFKLEGYLHEGTDEEVAVILCTPKKGTEKVTRFEGKIMVLTKWDALLQVTGIYDYPGSGKWKSGKEITVSYRFNEQRKAEINYLHQINTTKNRVSQQKHTEEAWLYVTKSLPGFEAGDVMRPFQTDDREVYKKLTYDPAFWQKNVPIQHTKLQAEVIQAIEKRKAFR